MATYATDLTTLADGDSDAAETWTELASPYNAGGTPADDDENFIQGVNCQSQTTGTKSGLVFSIVFDAGADQSGSFATNDVVLMWLFYAVIPNLETFANGGRRAVIGSDTSNAGAYAVGGSDDPYAPGWKNVAVDPTKSADYTIGSGNGGAWRYFGGMVNTLASISKGTPHAGDAIRYGRGEISCTGTGCDFDGLATYNDANTTSNYRRLGLFQDQGGGTFLWKGMMSLGLTATSATFSASNQTVLVDDTPAVYAAFNKIEVNHASTSVTWNNITFTAKGTTSPGDFEMIDNATVNWTGCSFNVLGSFIFQSNATLNSCNWNGCGQITHGAADFEACNFAGYEGTAGTGLMIYNQAADPDGELDNCSFTMGTALTHAIQFGTSTPSTITLRGITFSGYSASNEVNNSTLYFSDKGSDTNWIVNLVGCSGNITYDIARGTDTVSFVVDPVTTLITVFDNETKLALPGASVFVATYEESGLPSPLPYYETVTITRVTTTATVAHTAHGLATGKKMWIQDAVQEEYNGVHIITKIDDDSYSFTVEGSPTTPATGTITATAVIIEGRTDSNGQISDNRSLTGDQPIEGAAESGSGAIPYRGADILDSVDSANGISINVFLNRDN